MLGEMLVATGNSGKLREFTEALEAVGVPVFGLDALERPVPEPAETGLTFEDNARIKAEAYSLHTDRLTIADDSGIEVDALDGAPGVLSARYGGPTLDDTGRNAHLLNALRTVTDPAARTARFRCCLAVAREGTTLATFDGTVEGRIVERPRGDGGFGYDPLFWYEPFGATLAEVPIERKRRVSHRGRAISLLIDALAANRFG